MERHARQHFEPLHEGGAAVGARRRWRLGRRRRRGGDAEGLADGGEAVAFRGVGEETAAPNTDTSAWRNVLQQPSELFGPVPSLSWASSIDCGRKSEITPSYSQPDCKTSATPCSSMHLEFSPERHSGDRLHAKHSQVASAPIHSSGRATHVPLTGPSKGIKAHDAWAAQNSVPG